MSEEWTTVDTSPAVKEEEKVEFEIEGQEEQVDAPIEARSKKNISLAHKNESDNS